MAPSGWGEATLEGHTEAVEGTLNGFITSSIGLEAEDTEEIWQQAWRKSFYRGGPVFMSALSGIDIALWDLKARRLEVPIWQLLGGKVRQRVSVYAWIGGDRSSDIEAAAKRRLEQGFKAVKMNATEDVCRLAGLPPSVLQAPVERLKTVKALDMDAALDFHGRLHKPMAKQLAQALEPHHPLFIEEPLLSEHPEGIAASPPAPSPWANASTAAGTSSPSSRTAASTSSNRTSRTAAASASSNA